MQTLQFREWRTSYAVALTGPQRDALRTGFKANVQPTTGATNLYDVTPGNVVGATVAGDTAMLIEPKIAISRVLFLLAYCADPSAWRSDAAALGDAPDLMSGVAALHARLCERALRRGLLSGYHPVADDLHTVRGRVDLAEQLRRRPGVDLPLAVQFEEHDEDIPENQLLAAATRSLRRFPLRSQLTRRTLYRLSETLQNVTAVSYRPTAVPTVAWTRMNTHYRAAVELARLLLKLRTVDLQAGEHETAALRIDMSKLFEEFVRVSLREALGASERQFPTGSAGPRQALDVAGSIKLEPDLTYWPSTRCTFVGDVKYKRDWGHGHNDDLYQLLAYITAARLDTGTLVYADGPSGPASHYVEATGQRLDVRHLDLSLAPQQLLQQVGALAGSIRATDGRETVESSSHRQL